MMTGSRNGAFDNLKREYPHLIIVHCGNYDLQNAPDLGLLQNLSILKKVTTYICYVIAV